jgi:AraC-like DNA-binding protein
MSTDIHFKFVRPDVSLSDFVESFWTLHNASDRDKEIVVLPDGRMDLILSESPSEQFHIMQSGLETFPQQVILKSGTYMCAVSFKLLATEYIFHKPVATLLDYAEILPIDFWDFKVDDLFNFNSFCHKATQKITPLLPVETDARKQQLFQLIYSSNGNITVKELSERVYWSSRQINRYFNAQFGLPLKTYCNILRFRASFKHIKEGKLFPQEDFADQSHFIREVKKLSGVSPKELMKNENGRFIQFSDHLPE